MKELNQEQIVNETIDYYTNDNKRAVNRMGDCVYNLENNNGEIISHCAIGRCLLPKYQDLGNELIGNQESISELIFENDCESLDDMLQVQYRGQSLDFWEGLQSLHDVEDNWTEDYNIKLTNNGKDKATNLIIYAL